jgi:hypothetical protein
MNTPSPTVKHNSNDSDELFLIVGLSSMIFICLITLKLLCKPDPQIAVPIEIPVAVSISTQTLQYEIPVAVSIPTQTINNEQNGTIV